MKKFIVVCLVLVVVVGVFYMGNRNRAKNKEVFYQVQVEPVIASKNIDTTIKTKGKIMPKENKVEHIAIPFNCTITRLSVENGEEVAAGQPLLTARHYTPAEYQIQLSRMQEGIKGAERQIQVLAGKIKVKQLNQSNLQQSYQEGLEIIEQTLAKYAIEESQLKKKLMEDENLWKENVITRKEYETAVERTQLSLENLKIQRMNANKEKEDLKRNFTVNEKQILAELAELEYAQESEEKELQVKKLELERLGLEQAYTVSAEKAGAVLFGRNLYQGAAFMGYEPLLTIVDLKKLDSFYVEIQLLDSENRNIRIGNKAFIHLNNVQQETLEAVVANQMPTVQEKGDISYYTVKLDFTGEREVKSLNLNMPVDVTINSEITLQEIAGQKRDPETLYYTVPLSAILIRNNKRAVLVYTQDEEGKFTFAKLVYVDVLFSNEREVIVQANGLNENAMVITGGNYNLYGGEKVVIEQNVEGGSLNLNLFD